MTELFSVRETAKIFGLTEARLRYWMQTGFVGASVRQGGRFYYSLRDLVEVKATADLLTAGCAAPAVTRLMDSLRKQLPAALESTTTLKICSDGIAVVVTSDDASAFPLSSHLVLAFTLASLLEQIERALQERRSDDAVPQACDHEATDLMTVGSAYSCFADGLAAEDAGDLERAEHMYLQALSLQPQFAAAVSNLGNVRYARGDAAGARKLYEQALALDPTLPAPRFNLANVLEDLGEREHAISELRHVCLHSPAFADAHYNLGLLLMKVGSKHMAARYLERYVELEPSSAWAEQVRALGLVSPPQASA